MTLTRRSKVAADTGYGAAKMLACLAEEKQIAPHIPVFGTSERRDTTFARAAFIFDSEADRYTCPVGDELRPHWQAGRGKGIGANRWLLR